MLLSVGDQVAPGTYRLHSAFERAINFERRGCLVCVVDPSIGPGPINIVLRSLDPALRHTRLPPLLITSAALIFANRRYAFTARHRYDSTLGIPVSCLHRFRRNLPFFAEVLKAVAPPISLAFLLEESRRQSFRTAFDRAFAAHVQTAVDQLFHGRLLAGVRRLRGCGVGLTPSGDDFITGMLIAWHVLNKLGLPLTSSRSSSSFSFSSSACRRNEDENENEDGEGAIGRFRPNTANAIFAAARGENILSNTFLDLARRGRVFGRMKDLVAALFAGNRASVRKATEHLCSVGATSGADLATGLLMTLLDWQAGSQPYGEGPKGKQRRRSA